MTMRRHEGGACGKGPYHEPPCDPPTEFDLSRDTSGADPVNLLQRVVETYDFKMSIVRDAGDLRLYTEATMQFNEAMTAARMWLGVS